jgi:benzoylformate decarboxylase
LKLAAPEKPVVSLVGDGSLYYADSGLWTAAHHSIPVLYVISNNRGYGIVAGAFGGAQGHMKGTGEYEGVVLEGMDPVKIAEAFGVEGIHVETEPELENAIANGLDVTEKEGRPYLLDVRLPLGLPQGGRARNPFRLSKSGAR